MCAQAGMSRDRQDSGHLYVIVPAWKNLIPVYGLSRKQIIFFAILFRHLKSPVASIRSAEE